MNIIKEQDLRDWMEDSVIGLFDTYEKNYPNNKFIFTCIVNIESILEENDNIENIIQIWQNKYSEYGLFKSIDTISYELKTKPLSIKSLRKFLIDFYESLEFDTFDQFGNQKFKSAIIEVI